MKIYDVYVEQIHTDKEETRTRQFQVVGHDILHAIFCAGQVFHQNTEWVTEKLKVCTPNGKECFETVFEGWK